MPPDQDIDSGVGGRPEPIPASDEWILTVPEGLSPLRADKMLTALFRDTSRSQIQLLFNEGRVWRDEEPLSKSDKLRGGDVVSVTILPPKPLELRPADIPLNVVFEDRDLIVIDKEPGMVVHPGNGTGEDTLVHALLHHCRGKLSGIGGAERPGIVHRLDKDTSGLLVAAKSNRAYQGLARQFAERETEKEYLALVRCEKEVPGSGTILAPIGRHPVHRIRMAVRPGGREAISHYRTEETSGQFRRLRVRIETGRTHQIRVHLSSIGCPLVNDTLYGYKPRGTKPPHERIMLHAAKLVIYHPVTGSRMEFESAAPWDFEEVWQWTGFIR